MKTKKKKGEKYPTVLTQLDLMILETLDKNKEGYAVLELTKKLLLSPMSLRRRLRWLDKLGLLHKSKVAGKNKFIVTISKDGLTVLEMFNKLLK